jgi:hypothetical protein
MPTLVTKKLIGPVGGVVAHADNKSAAAVSLNVWARRRIVGLLGVMAGPRITLQPTRLLLRTFPGAFGAACR